MAYAADPLNAVGIALAGLTLPAQIFSGCVQAYGVVAGVKDAGKAINHQHWLFKVEYTRFLVWGQNFDVYGDGLNPEKLSPLVYESVVNTLAQIELLLKDAAEISARYGLQRLPDSEPPSNFARLLAHQRALVYHVDRSCSLLRKAQWAIYDQTNFATLVEQLKRYNDALYQFCPLETRHQLTVAIETDVLARTVMERGLEGVQELQLAAMHNLPPRMHILGRRAAARSRAHEREGAENGDVATGALLPAMSLEQMNILSQLPNDTPERRDWASLLPRYTPSNMATDLVIEWRPFDPLNITGALKEALRRRIQALVRMLQQNPKPPSFRALDCLGFLEDTRRARFGLVHRFPQGCTASGAGIPLTLFQILTKNHAPFLGDRFRLAAFLAEALYEFHASGWLHKSINSHNILFFPGIAGDGNRNDQCQGQRATSGILKNPFFAGFALARPDDPNADTSRVPPDPELGIYRHPDVQGSGGQRVLRYHPSHDIYSLGTLLLEIGTWNVLKNFNSRDLSGPAFKQLLLDKGVPKLGQAMGEKYMVAVRKCLDGHFDNLQSYGGRARDGEDYILDLQRSFYWEVVMVLRETRV